MSSHEPFIADDLRPSDWEGYAVDGHSDNVKLRRMAPCTISEELLTEYAKNELGAKRVSKAYLTTLRYIIANQARAEYARCGVELNIRSPDLGTERTMRTIIDQMADSGITFPKHVHTADGKSFTVQVYRKRLDLIPWNDPLAAEHLEQSYRQNEGSPEHYMKPLPASLEHAYVPY